MAIIRVTQHTWSRFKTLGLALFGLGIVLLSLFVPRAFFTSDERVVSGPSGAGVAHADTPHGGGGGGGKGGSSCGGVRRGDGDSCGNGAGGACGGGCGGCGGCGACGCF